MILNTLMIGRQESNPNLCSYANGDRSGFLDSNHRKRESIILKIIAVPLQVHLRDSLYRLLYSKYRLLLDQWSLWKYRVKMRLRMHAQHKGNIVSLNTTSND